MGTVDERTVGGHTGGGGGTEQDEDTAELPLLTRLNARGFRLVQLLDALTLAIVMVGTMVARFGWEEWPTYPRSVYWLSFTATLFIFLGTLYFGGLYEREPRLGYPPVLPRAMRLTLAAGGFTALINLAATGLAQRLGSETARALPMPITNLAFLIVLGAIGIAVNRRLVQAVRSAREGPARLILVGTRSEVDTAVAHLETDKQRADVVGWTTDPRGITERIDDLEPTDVVLLSSRWLDEVYPELIVELEFRSVNVLLRIGAKETIYGLQRVREVGGMPFVLLRSHTMPISRERFKRVTDLTILFGLMPLVLPLLGAVALYQLGAVGRPILFWQERVGAEGRTFQMVKFRTMTLGAEEDGRPRLASRDDPRIVAACRWLRASRLDELPQVWNVLKGEMSLVGPRPERPELTRNFERAIPGYSRRHEIPPGMTGLAQVQGRYHTDPEYKLGYDLQYLVNWSPVLDLEIILRTAWVLVTQRV